MSAKVHLAVAGIAGVVVGVPTALVGSWGAGVLAGWVAAAVAFLVATWPALWSMTSAQTAEVAVRADPGAAVRDVLLLALGGGSAVAVAIVIVPAGRSDWPMVLLGVAGVAASWLVLHTIFTLKYADRYYSSPKGGIDFNETRDPDYRDFAYFAFTVAMTFQVSDNSVSDRDIRSTVLRQGLLSFGYALIIISVTINVIAGLGSAG